MASFLKATTRPVIRQGAQSDDWANPLNVSYCDHGTRVTNLIYDTDNAGGA